jgi:FkbM family methyltransferase
MAITEDLRWLMAHPVQAVEYLEKARLKLKLYGHYDEVFIRQTYSRLYQAIRPGTTVLDLGAFVGDTAIYFAMNPNVKEVIAYESSPAVYGLLTRNINGSGLAKKIRAKNCAVGAHEGFVTNSTREITGTNRTLGYSGTRREAQRVRTVTLASCLDGLKRVAIKCDIEGAEKGLFRTDLSNVYAIILEHHNGSGRDIKRELAERGFSTEAVTGNENGGILFASRRPKNTRS